MARAGGPAGRMAVIRVEIRDPRIRIVEGHPLRPVEGGPDPEPLESAPERPGQEARIHRGFSAEDLRIGHVGVPRLGKDTLQGA